MKLLVILLCSIFELPTCKCISYHLVTLSTASKQISLLLCEGERGGGNTRVICENIRTRQRIHFGVWRALMLLPNVCAKCVANFPPLAPATPRKMQRMCAVDASAYRRSDGVIYVSHSPVPLAAACGPSLSTSVLRKIVHDNSNCQSTIAIAEETGSMLGGGVGWC